MQSPIKEVPQIEGIRRVLFVFEQFAHGGFETHLETLINELAEQGHELYCIGGPDFSRSRERHLVQRYLNVDLNSFTGSSVEKCATQIADLIARQRIQIVHIHPFLSFLPAAIGALMGRVPYVLTFHRPPDLPLWTRYFGGFFISSLARFVIPNAAGISCISEEAGAATADLFRLPEESIRVMRNPIDLEVYRPTASESKRSPCALLVSRLDDDKKDSVHAAFDLIRELQQIRADWRLIIAGTGQLEAELRRDADQAGLANVEWLGYRRDVHSLIQRSDLVVGVDRVILEALAAERLAVIASYQGALTVVEPSNFREMQRGNFGGRVLPCSDAKWVAQLVVGALETGRRQLTALRTVMVEDHDARLIARQWQELYAGFDRSQPQVDVGPILAWLRGIEQNSLRSLQWATTPFEPPAPLLGGPAETGALKQAMELRQDEIVKHGHQVFGLSENLSALRNELTQAGARIHQLETAQALSMKLTAEVGERAGFLAAERDAARAKLQELQDKIGESRSEADPPGTAPDHHGRDRSGKWPADHSFQQWQSDGLRESVDELSSRNAHLEGRLRQTEIRIASLRQELAHEQELLGQRISLLQKYLLRAEQVRRLTLSRCYEFRTDFEDYLERCRSQRVWRVMLWLRKAYALYSRKGTAGKWQSLKFLLATPRKGVGELDGIDLQFPSLPEYMPPDIMDPFFDGDAFDAYPGAMHAAELAIPRPRKYDVIIFPAIDFDFRFQRPQQIACQFARNGHRVWWVSPIRFLAPASAEAFSTTPLRENIWEIRLRSRQLDVYTDSLEADIRTAFVDSLTHLYRVFGIVESCAIVQLPFWRQIGVTLAANFKTKLAYDCMDDWDDFPSIGAFNHSEEKALVRDCDVLTVSAQKLVDKFKDSNVTAHLVRNGVDFDFFSSASSLSPMLPDVARPVVGYFGAIAEWMDLDLLLKVAASRPHYSFVLVGGIFNQDVSRLQSLPNVLFAGSRPHEEMPLYLREFDACLIPFQVNSVTNATDPIKLYEYLSQGKPVVATDMAELVVCGDLLYVAKDTFSFGTQLDRALKESDSDLRKRRIDYAAANTWAHRDRAIDKAVRASFPLVSIVIVTHNSVEYLRPCLNAIIDRTAHPSLEVIVVDNCSTDGTKGVLEEYVSREPRIRAFFLQENTGFASGNNFGARHAKGSDLVLLNADTIVSTGWLERLLRHASRDARVGVVVPVTNFAGNEVKVDVNYQDIEGMEVFAQSRAQRKMTGPLEIDVAPLFCALIPKRVWDEVGELDESFGIGMFEDDDFSFRMKQAGFRIVVAEDCFIHHFGQGSFQKLTRDSYDRIFETNRIIFETKWKRPWKRHQARPGVRPAHEDQRYDPVTFCLPASLIEPRAAVDSHGQEQEDRM